MKIEKIHVENFKGFSKAEFDFHPAFNLIVGENAAGKTSLLKAVSVALGAWSYSFPVMPHRGIDTDEVRQQFIKKGERPTFEPVYPSFIRAYGAALGKPSAVWLRTRMDARSLITKINSTSEAGYWTINFRDLGSKIASRISSGESIDLPLVAFYGTGRLWQKAEVEENQPGASSMEASVFIAYRDCFSARTSDAEMHAWFIREFEAIASGQVSDNTLKAVKTAALTLLPGARDLALFHLPEKHLVIEFEEGKRREFNALSDGQRTLLTLAGDIARRAVTLNPHLAGEAVLKTSGVVLIDELDLHLHPRWQRDIVKNLKSAFPAIQFFATTHSPQIISETPAEEIMLLMADGSWSRPNQSVGLDSNEVLREIMHAETISTDVSKYFAELDSLMRELKFTEARAKIAELRAGYGELTKLAGAEAYMTRIEILGKKGDKK